MNLLLIHPVEPLHILFGERNLQKPHSNLHFLLESGINTMNTQNIIFIDEIPL